MIGLYLLAAQGCTGDDPSVVIYTSVDQVFSEPVLKDFERESGIRTLAVYDVEAAKTTGLVQRLLSEAEHPRADLFWNNEFVQTMVLDERKLLAPPEVPRDLVIRPGLKVPGAGWLPLGCRYRVFLAGCTVEQPPLRIRDLPEALERLRIGMACPAFGTTATWAASVRAELGSRESHEYFSSLVNGGVRVFPGNSVVRDRVVSGGLDLGLTDSDDACAALTRGNGVRLILPDQDGRGTLEIPGSVALIARSEHPAAARRLMRYLLRRDVEERLILEGAFQASVRIDGSTSPCLGERSPVSYSPDFRETYGALHASQADLAGIFLK